MFSSLSLFHFLHPSWLLALIPLALLLLVLARRQGQAGAWQAIVDPHLLPLLTKQNPTRARQMGYSVLALAWLITVLGLADPSWEQALQPAFESDRALVVVFDLSQSMQATDLSPSRFTQARLKVTETLNTAGEGLVGLVAFAGDAFTVAPLSRDKDTLLSQLRALEPGLMPVQGSRADLGLDRASDLLQQAGIHNGTVLLVTDGLEGNATIASASAAKENGHRVAVLGVGTAQGAPVPNGRGGFVVDAQGTPVMAKLDEAALQQVAAAGGGSYHRITADNQDLSSLLNARDQSGVASRSGSTSTNDYTKWIENGPLFAVLLLPLAALAFRRGWLLSVGLVAILIAPAQPVTAGVWDDLWQRREQQADVALRDGDADSAAQLSADPSRRGSAEFKRGNYAAALDALRQTDDADGAYNEGNALAKLGEFESAISAYDKALVEDPTMEDAVFNKHAIEQMLAAQKEQSEQQQSTQREQQKPADGDEHSDAEDGDSGRSDPDNKQGNASSPQAGFENDNQSADSEQGKQNGSADSSGPKGERHAGSAQNDSESPASATPEVAADDTNSASGDVAVAGEDAAAKPNDSSDGDTSSAAIGEPSQLPTERDAAGNDSANAESPQSAARDTGKDFERAAKAAENDSNESELATARDPTRDTQTGASADKPAQHSTNLAAADLRAEEKAAAEQWLRRIPDDPGGLLRNKFLYQYRQRGARNAGGQSW